MSKVVKSIEDSVGYMRELFSQSKLSVTQGKKVQRKVRYEKLKTEFQQLIVSIGAVSAKDARGAEESNTTHLQLERER